MMDWIADHQKLLWITGVVSAAVFIASLFIMPALVVRIRPDYFAHEERPPGRWSDRSRSVRIGIHIGRNLVGIVLIVAGLAMLALPGQGMLTILIGVFLLDFPGKYRFEQWLVRRRGVLWTINWFRRRAGREPMTVWKRPAATTPAATSPAAAWRK